MELVEWLIVLVAFILGVLACLLVLVAFIGWVHYEGWIKVIGQDYQASAGKRDIGLLPQ